MAYGELPVTCSPRPATRCGLPTGACWRPGRSLALPAACTGTDRGVRRARERLVLAREEERRRLRRDLHDGLGPALAWLMLKVENVWALVPTEPRPRSRTCMDARRHKAAVADVRRLVEGLRPPAVDDLGLGPAVRQAVLGLTTPAGIGADVESLSAAPTCQAQSRSRCTGWSRRAVTNMVRRSAAACCRVAILIVTTPSSPRSATVVVGSRRRARLPHGDRWLRGHGRRTVTSMQADTVDQHARAGGGARRLAGDPEQLPAGRARRSLRRCRCRIERPGARTFPC